MQKDELDQLLQRLQLENMELKREVRNFLLTRKARKGGGYQIRNVLM